MNAFVQFAPSSALLTSLVANVVPVLFLPVLWVFIRKVVSGRHVIAPFCKGDVVCCLMMVRTHTISARYARIFLISILARALPVSYEDCLNIVVL